MSGQFQLNPIAQKKKHTMASCWHYNSASDKESNGSEEANLELSQLVESQLGLVLELEVEVDVEVALEDAMCTDIA